MILCLSAPVYLAWPSEREMTKMMNSCRVEMLLYWKWISWRRRRKRKDIFLFPGWTSIWGWLSTTKKKRRDKIILEKNKKWLNPCTLRKLVRKRNLVLWLILSNWGVLQICLICKTLHQKDRKSFQWVRLVEVTVHKEVRVHWEIR